jgi:hypothetical protein
LKNRYDRRELGGSRRGRSRSRSSVRNRHDMRELGASRGGRSSRSRSGSSRSKSRSGRSRNRHQVRLGIKREACGTIGTVEREEKVGKQGRRDYLFIFFFMRWPGDGRAVESGTIFPG